MVCLTRRSARGLVGSAALAVLLAACASAQAPRPAPAQGAPAPAGPAGSTATGPTEWVVAITEETPSLDPIYGQFTAGSSQAQTHIFDTLVQYVGLNLKLTPMLAESWKPLDDQTWEFSLRKGV